MVRYVSSCVHSSCFSSSSALQRACAVDYGIPLSISDDFSRKCLGTATKHSQLGAVCRVSEL